MTGYGFHQEQVAAALTGLLATPVPEDLGARDDILFLREHVRLALIDRIQLLGRGDTARPHLRLVYRSNTHAEIVEEGYHWLHHLAVSLPTDRALRLALPPGQVLAGPRADATGEAWRQVATQLGVGTYHLGTSATPVRSPAPEWALLVDAAETTEAVLALDQRLRANGVPVPSSSDRLHSPLDHYSARAACATIAREARWRAGQDGRATADRVVSLNPAYRQVAIVRDLDTLAVGQRRIQQLTTPRHGTAKTYNPRGVLTLRTATELFTAQTRVNLHLARLATRVPGLEAEVAQRFHDRAARLDAVSRAARDWVDVIPGAPRPDLLNQQREVLRAAMAAREGDATAGGLRDLDAVSHEAAEGLARGIYRQLGYPGVLQHLRAEDDAVARFGGHGAQQSRLGRCCRAVFADEPPPPAESFAPLERDRLREVLGATPAVPLATELSPQRPRRLRRQAGQVRQQRLPGGGINR